MNLITLCQPFMILRPEVDIQKLFIYSLLFLAFTAAISVKCITVLISKNSSKERKFESSICIAASVFSLITFIGKTLIHLNMLNYYSWINEFIFENIFISITIPSSVLAGIASYSLFSEKDGNIPIILSSAAGILLFIMNSMYDKSVLTSTHLILVSAVIISAFWSIIKFLKKKDIIHLT